MSTTYPASAVRRSALALLSTLTGLAAFYIAGAETTSTQPDLPSPVSAEVAGIAPVSDSQQALELCAELLSQAERTLAADNTAEAEFHKRERVRGKLLGPNVIQLKVRREPLSVYMRWQAPEEGQEVIWQENANNSQILVHPGGWRRKIVPLMKVDPFGERAMANGRRPINTVGIWKFNDRLLEFVRQQRADANVQVDVAEVSLAGCECFRFRFIQPNYAPGLDYQQVLILIDRQRGLPVALEHYGWPEGGVGEPLLEESYAFLHLKLGVKICDADFDVANPNYEFRR